MSEPVYFITLALFFGTILAVFAMRYVALSLQARARLASEQATRAAWDKIAAEQAACLSALARVEAVLAGLVPQVGSIEVMLKEVG